MSTNLKTLDVRGRLLRRIFYRLWKAYSINQARKFILKIDYESSDEIDVPLPSIMLSTYSRPEDSKVLMMLFSGYDLVWLVPRSLAQDKSFKVLNSVARTLAFDPKQLDFSFFRNLLLTLKQFNRSVVMLPEATRVYFDNLEFSYEFLVKLAVRANVPLQPVVIRWDTRKGISKKCNVLIGKKYFISPRHPDFKDIFFRKRVSRKLARLSVEDYRDVGVRVSNKFEAMKRNYGSDIS